MRFGWFGGGALVAVGAIVIASGCSSTRSPDEKIEKTASPIQNATLSPDTIHKYAVGVCGGGRNNCQGICSGALIAPNVVATARHCIDGTPKLIDCKTNPTFGGRKVNTIDITTHHQMFQGTTGWHRVVSIAVPADNHICGNDLALLKLDAPIAASETPPIIPGVQYSMSDSQYLGHFAAIGYGNTGPTTGGSGTRRMREKISLLCVPGDEWFPCPPEINQAEFVGDDGTCSGDSGSSAYETKSFESGKPVSFGVLSRGGENEAGTECKGSVYTRFDAHRQFVIDTVKAMSNDWSLYPEPSWTTYVPPSPKKPPPPEEEAGTKPQKKNLGEECTGNSGCKSLLCADQGDGTKVCTKKCDEADPTTCDEGFVCLDGMCFVAPEAAEEPAATTTTKKTTSGCAAVPNGSGANDLALLGLGAFVLGSAVSRVRRRKNG